MAHRRVFKHFLPKHLSNVLSDLICTEIGQAQGAKWVQNGCKTHGVPLTSFLQLRALLAELYPTAVTLEHCCCSCSPAIANTSLLSIKALPGHCLLTGFICPCCQGLCLRPQDRGGLPMLPTHS